MVMWSLYHCLMHCHRSECSDTYPNVVLQIPRKMAWISMCVYIYIRLYASKQIPRQCQILEQVHQF